MKNYLLAALLAVPAFAQSTIHDSLVKHWKTSGEFTIAVANAMPAENYTFKPNPAEMSFGQVMTHIAAANMGACAMASGQSRPQFPEAVQKAMKDKSMTLDKDDAVKFLQQSFELCNKAVEGMTPEKLDAVVGQGDRKMTGFEWLWSYFTHTAHHRGQAEVYLRLKDIKPPSYEF